MARRLCISVRFLTCRYHGEEWPPSPARLFQALVAGANIGCRALNWGSSRKTLKWLEEMSPPEIIASAAPSGLSYKTYTPNNDTDSSKVLSLIRTGMSAPDAIRREGLLAPKIFRPRLTDGDDFSVHYLWQLPDDHDAVEHEQHICAMARNVVALGWGIDVVVVDGQIVNSQTLPSGRHYIPVRERTALSLKCPTQGFLADLEQAYSKFKTRYARQGAVDTDTRPRNYQVVSYRVAGEIPGCMCVTFDLRDLNANWRSFQWQEGMVVSAWLRHAVTERFKKEGWDENRIAAYVSGHTAKGEENERLSYVPLPSIGHDHSDGKHRRVLVALPFGDDGASLPIIERMDGEELLSLQGESKAWLSKSLRGDKMLERYLGIEKEWMSVTPIVLHGMDFDAGCFRPRKAEKLILQAFEKSGYKPDAIEEFSYQPAPFWRGPGAARQSVVPKHLEHWPRYHIRVVFKNPVTGPVLAGIGRHYGIGLFATR